MSVSTAPVVSLIRGDGIGPEISEAVLRMLDACGAQLSFEEVPAGEGALLSHHDPMPEVTLASIAGMTLGTNGDDGLIVNFWLNAGSTYNARTNTIGLLSATVDIAQIQVEEGATATGFEMRHANEQIALCQRYYNTLKAYVNTTPTNVYFQQMRAAPTVAGGGAGFALDDAGLGNSIVCHQTTGAVQTLTLNAEI